MGGSIGGNQFIFCQVHFFPPFRLVEKVFKLLAHVQCASGLACAA